ncbi:ABC transporter permease [Gabonibacter chumensis]|uniref:ABC transporter permease n=1 Tax=Gabonibacter chumensis TaxID=2972474 RepID=UPI002573E9AE|nr:ABC transporter permease [Gabonibacter chumensis]MCR9012472.1 ABC transporter permease [Gabonibacter chumensis]
MNLYNINTVARFESKILRRSWLFRIFTPFSLFIVACFQLVVQGDLLPWSSWNFIALSSYMPYLNASIVGVPLVIMVVLLAKDFWSGSKWDTMEMVYVRPMSNADFIIGKAWGNIRVFMGVALISLVISATINLLLSDAPFNGFLYLFYWIVFLLPSLLFILGLSFFIASLIHNRALTILFLLGFVFLTLYFLDTKGHGIFDFLASTIPNTYSDMAGYPDLGFVLLQRLGWLLLGFGLIGYSITFLRRIPNRPDSRIVQLKFSTLFAIGGILCGCMLYFSFYQVKTHRANYIASYDRYSLKDKLILDRQTITYRQMGSKIEVNTSLRLVNPRNREVNSVILYLNPGLQVKRLLKGDQELAYFRDNQVIEIKENVPPGDTLVLVLEYAGRIDERICYLNQPEKDIFDSQTIGYSFFRNGKRYAIVEKGYTLLTPECLWYPVSEPPVNLKNRYDARMNFTSYSLTVVNTGDRTVLSQGESSRNGEITEFKPEYPLPGISLCIGSYKKYSVNADSVSFELYLVEGHDDFMQYLTYIKDSMEMFVSSTKEVLEGMKGRDYPYRRFMLIETPASFASYYCFERGGSERIQPEMALMPERGIGFWTMNFKISQQYMKQIYGKETSPIEIERKMLDQFIQSVFFNEYAAGNENVSIGVFSNNTSTDFALTGNQFDISPLFFNYTGQLDVPDYPVMNVVLTDLMKRQDGKEKGQTSNWSTYSSSQKKAMRYLKDHSLKEALEASELSSDVLYQIIKLKSLMLKEQYFIPTIPAADFRKFINNYLYEHRNAQIDFVAFDGEFVKRFGVSWLEILPEWYMTKGIPAYLIQDYLVEEVEEGGNDLDGRTGKRYRLQISVYNDSDIAGVVTFGYTQISTVSNAFGSVNITSNTTSGRSENILIGPREAKKIVIMCDGEFVNATLNTNLSSNLPIAINYYRDGGSQKTRETTTGVTDIDAAVFFPKEGERIVDNESEGFKVMTSSSGNKMRKWMKANETTEYKDFYTMTASEDWSPVVSDEFYGGHIRSGWIKKGGDGRAKVGWTTRLDKAGYYELSVFIPNSVELYRIKVNNKGEALQNVNAVRQYYTVYRNGEKSEEEVEIPLPERGWLSLGRFYFSPGEATIVLNDKRSVAGQIIYADAVKWVFDGEK